MNLHVRPQVLIKYLLPRLSSRMASSVQPSTATRQPPWSPPPGGSTHPRLRVYNSLTRSKVPFTTIDRQGREIKWYACGPTVYDDSHLGHARNYVTTDILRRILRDYFKYTVRFVMNITDVDDKIILRGRQRHLFEQYQKTHRYIDSQVLDDVKRAWLEYVHKYLPNITEPAYGVQNFEKQVAGAYQGIDVAGAKLTDAEAKIKMHIRTARDALKALTTSDVRTIIPVKFYEQVNDVMCYVLDRQSGSTIKGDDHGIFLKLTSEYEDRFFRDMADLNVQRPEEVTRVTEYGRQIAEFTNTIVDNKFAYVTSDGSVYFDIKAFEAAGMPYARLEPWNRSDKALQADGEGALSQRATEKRSDADFALWKASKPGEPSWPSPWGPGRPGWHIECSAMATDRLGSQLDIHSGGIDLAFPHHDNELAQTEAFLKTEDKQQWVNYFLHMGHLSISGAKMSKSLKNFTTIRAAIEMQQWTSRSLRIVFLLGSWKDGIEITDDLVKEGASWEDRVDNFFLNAREALKTSNQSRSIAESPLHAELERTIQKVDDALCDSFDTPRVMAAISNLITTFNTALKTSSLPTTEVHDSAIFVTRMVNVFGLNGDGSPDTEEVGWSGLDIPESAKQFVEPLAAMRDQLRQAAIAKQISPQLVEQIISDYPSPDDAQPIGHGRPRASFASVFREFTRSIVATVQAATSNGHVPDKTDAPTISSTLDPNVNREILNLCDRLRDEHLWSLDVYLEDRDNAPALVRPVTNGLKNARKEKDERAKQKEEAKRKAKEAERAKHDKGRLDPREMFRVPPLEREYGEWDAETGLPVKMRDGTRVSESRAKKCRKEWERQRERHEAWCRAQGGGERGGGVTGA